jgi:hypothetical protein
MLKVTSISPRNIKELAVVNVKITPYFYPAKSPIAPIMAHAAVHKSAAAKASWNLKYQSSFTAFLL